MRRRMLMAVAVACALVCRYGLAEKTRVSPTNVRLENRIYPEVVGVQDDGKVVLTGGRAFIQGYVRNNCIRMNADGTLDVGWGPTMNFDAMAVYSNRVYVAWLEGGIGHVSCLNDDGSVGACCVLPGTNSFVNIEAVRTNGVIVSTRHPQYWWFNPNNWSVYKVNTTGNSVDWRCIMTNAADQILRVDDVAVYAVTSAQEYPNASANIYKIVTTQVAAAKRAAT